MEIVFQVNEEKRKRLKRKSKDELIMLIVSLELMIKKLEAENRVQKWLLEGHPNAKPLDTKKGG